MNVVGIPFKIVLDKSFEIISVIKIPNNITSVNKTVEASDLNGPINIPVKNIVIIVIRVGKRPLQGTKLLVIMAINLSLGESIILHPTIPAALHPNPIHIVKACLPHAFDFLKKLSKLNATLGRYPKSSSKVNRGKNIAIGGSITAITHARVLYIP